MKNIESRGVTRRGILAAVGVGIAGGAIGYAWGNFNGTRRSEAEIASLMADNSRLYESNAEQLELLVELVKSQGALEVKYRGLKADATQSAYEMLEYRVEATAEAYNKDR